MAEYKLEVTTGNMTHAGTFDHVFVTLIGTGGKSERTELDNYGVDFKTGMVRTIQSSPSQVPSWVVFHQCWGSYFASVVCKTACSSAWQSFEQTTFLPLEKCSL